MTGLIGEKLNTTTASSAEVRKWYLAQFSAITAPVLSGAQVNPEAPDAPGVDAGTHSRAHSLRS